MDANQKIRLFTINKWFKRYSKIATSRYISTFAHYKRS